MPGSAIVSQAEAERLTPIWLGLRPYGPIYELQQALLAARREGSIGDCLLLLEHQPVVTLGRGAKDRDLLMPEAQLRARQLAVERVDRGGEVTLHAPGQLVAYPVVRLQGARRDVRAYVGQLRETMADLVRPLGVEGGPVPELVGLWVDERAPQRWGGPEAAGSLAKLGAIGVRLSRWVTLHGFALNLSLDLSLYRFIVPCGITQHGVTSVRQLCGGAPTARELAAPAAAALGRRLGLEAEPLLDAEAWSLADVLGALRSR